MYDGVKCAIDLVRDVANLSDAYRDGEDEVTGLMLAGELKNTNNIIISAAGCSASKP